MQLFGLISRKVTVPFPAIRAIKQAFIYVSSRKKEKQYQSMCTLLPSMQFGTLHHVEPDGKQVFITANKKLVCPHGECSSTILFWLREERLAREKGMSPPARGGCRGISRCDCQNTDGLNGKHDVESGVNEMPSSLFEYLEQQNTESITVKGRGARCIPYLPGPTFVTATGKLCCRHGASRLSLINKQKAGSKASARLPTCGCVLHPIPVRRGGLRAVQMGKHTKVRPTQVKIAVAETGL